MARIRTIKPDFWTDEDIALLDSDTKLLAIGLLNHSDDEGYFKAHEALVKAAVFPFSDNSLNIHGMLKRLENARYLTLFSGTDGKQYGHIRNFNVHQKVNRPNPSKIKALKPITDNSVSNHGKLTGGKEQGTGKGKEISTTTAHEENSADPDFQQEDPHRQTVDENHPVWSWQPSEIVLKEISRYRIPVEFVSEQLSEFKTYRSGLKENFTNYDSKFMTQVIASWKRIGRNWQPSPEFSEGNSHDPRYQQNHQQGSGRKLSTIERALTEDAERIRRLDEQIREAEAQERDDQALGIANG